MVSVPEYLVSIHYYLVSIPDYMVSLSEYLVSLPVYDFEFLFFPNVFTIYLFVPLWFCFICIAHLSSFLYPVVFLFEKLNGID
jgi:hypothetical protein